MMILIITIICLSHNAQQIYYYNLHTKIRDDAEMLVLRVGLMHTFVFLPRHIFTLRSLTSNLARKNCDLQILDQGSP